MCPEDVADPVSVVVGFFRSQHSTLLAKLLLPLLELGFQFDQVSGKRPLPVESVQKSVLTVSSCQPRAGTTAGLIRLDGGSFPGCT